MGADEIRAGTPTQERHLVHIQRALEKAPRQLARDLMTDQIQTARLNYIDSQAWLADVLDRIASHPVSRLDELLPWNWQSKPAAIAA